MKLEDLIDLEAQIAADEDRDAETLRARDRDAFGQLQVDDPSDRHTLLTRWLAVLRGQGQAPDLGRRVLFGYRWLTYLLVLLGLGLGWSAASLLLHYEQGQPPVNVGYFLLVVIGVQLGLLVLLVVGLPLLRVFPNLPLAGDLHAVLRGVANLLERAVAKADDHLSTEQRESWRVARSRLKTRAMLYQPVEQWLLVGLTQLFGVAFNLGVLACCLRLVFFSDLAFSWSTTAETIDAALVHRIVDGLAAPWAAIFPDAVPSLELVEKSQYFRLDGRYAGAAPGATGDPQLVGGWWRFLIAATVVYGLVPRALLWVGVRIARGRALANLPLDTADVDRIVRRLRAPVVTTRAQALDPQGAEPAHAPVTASEPATAEDGGACSVILWRDMPAGPDAIARAVKHNFGCTVERTVQAGGVDFASDRSLAEELAQAEERILVLAEGWEAPDKSIRRFLGDLRQATGPRRKLTVALVEEAGPSDWRPASSHDVEIWRDRLTLLEDPYLGVEPLEAAR